jgi:predicted metal-dependent HD superfamily phosphohydrolase
LAVTTPQTLLQRWAALLPDHPELGRRLLSRWEEPHRRYHDARHLSEVLAGVDLLAGEAENLTAVRLAAWFHDAVHQGKPDDEARSAALAAAELRDAGADPGLVASVVRLVEMTRTHDPVDADGRILSDADLWVLAAPPRRYDEYLTQVRAEYAHLPVAVFARGRVDVLSALLSRPRLFFTALGVDRWEGVARQRLSAELVALSEG